MSALDTQRVPFPRVQSPIHLIHTHSSHVIHLGQLSFSVVLLVASIPMAMEVVTTTVMALGSRELAAMGAIVARLASIEEMAGKFVNVVASNSEQPTGPES